jgi:hypothetical protein
LCMVFTSLVSPAGGVCAFGHRRAIFYEKFIQMIDQHESEDFII